MKKSDKDIYLQKFEIIYKNMQVNYKTLSYYLLLIDLIKIFLVTLSIAVFYKYPFTSALINLIILSIFFIIFLFAQTF